MSRLYRSIAAVALVGAVAACGTVKAGNAGPVEPQTQKPGSSSQSAALQEFQARVNTYLELRKEATKKSPPPKPSEDIAKITAAQDVLAATIQSMRKTAKPGEIFTPGVQTAFRQLMSPELKGKEGRETKHEMKEDAPASVPMKVNGKYPDAAALPTVPANILTALPVLPKELEYRIIMPHLILRDVDANIIVDYMTNAIR